MDRIDSIIAAEPLAGAMFDHRPNRFGGEDFLAGRVRIADDDGTVNVYAFTPNGVMRYKMTFDNAPVGIVAQAVHAACVETQVSDQPVAAR